MGLKIMKGRDGQPRETWYARFTRNGQKIDVNLKVPIRGTVPVDACGRFDADGEGDAPFAQSRARALAALERMQTAARTTGETRTVKDAKTADIQANYYRARTGRSIRGVRLTDLPRMWRDLKRETPPTEARMRVYDSTFADFAAFAAKWKCKSVNEITPEIGSAWFDSLRETFAWETVKNKMSLLSGAFRRWATSGKANPFLDVIKRHGKGDAKIQREPLGEAEIARVFACSRGDAFFHPLIVCAATTGMRVGDVCRLKWENVDLRGGFIDVVTAKAGVRVTIPIFGELRKVLEARLAECPQNEPFVFPAAAARYDAPSTRSGIMRGVKPFIARAVYGEKPDTETAETPTDAKQTPDEVIATIAASRYAPGKRERIADTYRRFTAGDSYADITAATGRHKGQVTQDLQAVEELIGRRIRPGDKYARRRKGACTARELIERTRVDRAVGKLRGSIYGWHSFRTAFVVLAVENGIPVEEVQKIVGHSDVKMTMDYFRPRKKHAAERVRKQMRGTVLEGADRKAIGGGAVVDVRTDGGELAPAAGRTAAVRALALARAVLGADQAATVAAVIQAAGVDADKAPERVLSLIAATVDADTNARIAAVIRAAGLSSK